MKDYVLRNKKGLLLVVLGLLVTGIIEFSNYVQTKKIYKNISYDILESSEMKVVTDEEKLINFFNLNQAKINFYADAFRIDREVLSNLIKENYLALDILNTENSDKVLIDYLFTLETEQKNLFNYNVVNNEPTKDYMVSLIKYYSNIYSDIDFKIASAIAEIESGYSSKYMLKCNNIFGGLASGKLIKYRTIEYGILKYIKLLNDGYFAKGLSTVEKIGRKYNPMMTANGKTANPYWVKNVSNAMNHYDNVTEINNIEELMALQ